MMLFVSNRIIIIIIVTMNDHTFSYPVPKALCFHHITYQESPCTELQWEFLPFSPRFVRISASLCLPSGPAKED